eukprot:m.50443 g.50443  ORF g.50443 m.50443 type:complete len:483 (-) comp6544_c0_seq1:28-1476(-)
MSLRGLWVARESTPAQLLCSRRFPTVERRARLIYGSCYAPLPSDADLCALAVAALRRREGGGGLQSCSQAVQDPVYCLDGAHWPVVIMPFQGDLYIAVPLVEHEDAATQLQSIPLSLIPGVTAACAFLEKLTGVVSSEILAAKADGSYIGDLQKHLMAACPLGAISGTDPTTCGFIWGKYPTKLPQNAQAVAWKAPIHKGQQMVQIAAREYVHGEQYDHADTPDTVAIEGTLRCRADLDGTPEVTLTAETKQRIYDLTSHPCVQSLDLLSDRKQVKLRFLPPADAISLCHYKIDSSGAGFPIRGFYQMKREADSNQTVILVQLKLHDSLRGAQLVFCDVRIPFYSKNLIVGSECSPNVGSVSVAPNQQELVWNVGNKFPPKTLEVFLSATLTFGPAPAGHVFELHDPFCSDQTSYISLSFRFQDACWSQAHVDNKSLTVYQKSKPKLLFGRELLSGDYRIWNSLAPTTRACPQPPDLNTGSA